MLMYVHMVHIHINFTVQSPKLFADIDTASSSNERTSSCGSSSVSTLQLHTPGFGVRASGRRSIVLPKPEPHIEFPPAPPPHEYYTMAAMPAQPMTMTTAAEPQHPSDTSRLSEQQQQQQQSSIYGDPASTTLGSTASYATLTRQHQQHPTMPRHHRASIIGDNHAAEHAQHDDDDGHDDDLDEDDHQLQQQHNINYAHRQHQHSQQYHHQQQQQQLLLHGHADDDVHLPYCSLSNCNACVPEHVPVYAISSSATLMRGRSGRRSTTAAAAAMAFDEHELYSPAGSMLVLPPAVPPNNFGLSKRGLLQIDYSFNWNNLYRFISSGGH